MVLPSTYLIKALLTQFLEHFNGNDTRNINMKSFFHPFNQIDTSIVTSVK